MIVADATVLVALSKMGRLVLLRDVYGRVIIGEVVKIEVLDQGKAISAPGVEQIERALEERWVRVVRLAAKERRLMRRILRNTRLDEGEAESLSLAHGRKLRLIVDDKQARALAATLGIAYLGTAGMLLAACLRGHISLEELEEAVRNLSRVMWLSPSVVAEILRVAREAKA